ncbi:hypothetical protein HYALB_00013883 [Hymenoscyphus albidus]|uniref:Uncharacterized protein n=1 Tax=Hymenoscyphus albidus TaxID=595503 RepID=A0A9N9LUB0_9HELO|nr:hypothetical protein HYALB_00013883 [Hymenoscyphus albidus]
MSSPKELLEAHIPDRVAAAMAVANQATAALDGPFTETESHTEEKNSKARAAYEKAWYEKYEEEAQKTGLREEFEEVKAGEKTWYEKYQADPWNGGYEVYAKAYPDALAKQFAREVVEEANLIEEAKFYESDDDENQPSTKSRPSERQIKDYRDLYSDKKHEIYLGDMTSDLIPYCRNAVELRLGLEPSAWYEQPHTKHEHPNDLVVSTMDFQLRDELESDVLVHNMSRHRYCLKKLLSDDPDSLGLYKIREPIHETEEELAAISKEAREREVFQRELQVQLRHDVFERIKYELSLMESERDIEWRQWTAHLKAYAENEVVIRDAKRKNFAEWAEERATKSGRYEQAKMLLMKCILGRLDCLPMEALLMGDARLMFLSEDEHWRLFNNLVAYFNDKLAEQEYNMKAVIEEITSEQNYSVPVAENTG